MRKLGHPIVIGGLSDRNAAKIRRNVLGPNLAARRGDGKTATRIHQLANVARPIKVYERAFGSSRHQFWFDAQFLPGDRQIVTQQLRNILAPLAQWWNLDPNYIETVQEILAKVAGLDAQLEILMSRGDDANVDLHRGLSADTVELAFGQHTQQACLQRRRHIADFVEEQRAAIRLFESSPTQCIGTGEGAFFVSE